MTRTALNVIDWYIDNDFCRGANGEDESALIADRALVAAAPDLLEALKQLACEADEDMPAEYRTDSFSAALEAAWDAITKADGEPA